MDNAKRIKPDIFGQVVGFMMPTPDSYQLTLLIIKSRKSLFQPNKDYQFYAIRAAFGDIARTELPLLDGRTLISAYVLFPGKLEPSPIARPEGGHFDNPLESFQHPYLPSLMGIELSEASGGGGRQPRPQMQRILRR
jgi:hypothetical protein